MITEDKMIWYEIILYLLPFSISEEGKKINAAKFYVDVLQWEQFEEYGKIRISMNPHIGNYNNFEEYNNACQNKKNIHTITIADTILDRKMAYDIEDKLVRGLRSCNKKYGFNKKH